MNKKKYGLLLIIMIITGMLCSCGSKGAEVNKDLINSMIGADGRTEGKDDSAVSEEEENKDNDAGSVDEEELGAGINVVMAAEKDVAKKPDDSGQGANNPTSNNSTVNNLMGVEGDKAPAMAPTVDAVTNSFEASSMASAASVGATSTVNVEWDPGWKYAENSRIHSSPSVLYKVSDNAKTVAVNAGHGTKGGTSVKTLCHPDGSPKVTGGSTSQGSVSATAVSGGTTLSDGTPEAVVTFKMAVLVRDRLLKKGYNVLMIRDGDDAQLDNVARSVMANNNADIHISIHYDSTENDKGFFYIGVPELASYRAMEPVASNYEEHQRLGQSILTGVKNSGVKVFKTGTMALDLTQTSYSTIPSVDLEVGDRGSSHAESVQSVIASGIANGIDIFFGK